jgi:hypothetical protein
LIELVQVVKATQRIQNPRELGPSITFFSEKDIWIFQEVVDTKTCETCRRFALHGEFHGNHLRLNFPDLVILDSMTIGGPEPDGGGLVHPNCRCFLLRLIEEE